MVRGSAVSSGLNGRSSHPRKQQTTRARSGPPPPRSYTSGNGVVGRTNSDISRPARIPGALDSTCASPCGNTIRSPSLRRIGGSPTTCPQHAPRAIRWYSITRWAPGITIAAISRDGGASATHGDVSSKSKYTAPVRRTDRSTFDRTSAGTPAARAPDARSSRSDGKAGWSFIRMAWQANRTLAHG